MPHKKSISFLALLSIAITISLTIFQYCFFSTAGFLGVTSDKLTAGIIDFYPYEIFLSLFKILGYIGLIVFFWIFLARIGVRALADRPILKFFFIILNIASVILIELATFIKYPAVYEPFASSFLLSWIFKASFYANPLILYIAASSWTIIPIWQIIKTLLIDTRFSKIRWALLVFLLASIGTLAFHKWAATTNTIAKASKTPNVLFIAIDSLRADRFGQNREEKLPNLSELLYDRRSIFFTDHIVGVPRTFPSWIETLQGKYAGKTGIRHMFPSIKDRNKEFKSFVSQIKKIGLQTAAISDFAGDIFPRFETGFDFINAPHLNLKTIIRMNTALAFPLFTPAFTLFPGSTIFKELKQSPVLADANKLTEEGISYLQNNKDKPFLLTLFYSTAHFPYAAPWPWYNKYADKNYRGPFWFQKNPDLNITSSSSPYDIQQVKALYDGAISGIDDSIGKLFNWLKNNNQWDNTIIVVTADHGEELYENDSLHGHGEHLYGNYVINVPLLIKLHKETSLPERTRIQFTTRSIDVAPTLISLVGAQPLENIDGQNILPWIFDQRLPPPNFSAYSETCLWFSRTGKGFFQKQRLDYPGISGLLSIDPGYSADITLDPKYENIVISAKHRSLISGDYKLIYLPTEKGAYFRLFNRRKDPLNKIEISEKEPQIFESLKEKMLMQIQELEGQRFQIVGNFVVPTF